MHKTIRKYTSNINKSNLNTILISKYLTIKWNVITKHLLPDQWNHIDDSDIIIDCLIQHN